MRLADKFPLGLSILLVFLLTGCDRMMTTRHAQLIEDAAGQAVLDLLQPNALLAQRQAQLVLQLTIESLNGQDDQIADQILSGFHA